MTMTRLFLFVATTTLLANLTINTSFGATKDWWNVVSDLKVGQTERQVRERMGRYKEDNWQSLTNRFNRRLRFLGDHKPIVWLVDATTLDTEGGETYVIAVFSKDKQLTDLLHFRAALDLRPIIRGRYAQRLESIKKGMNVDDIYRLLGEEMPYQYYRDKSGKWIVRFSYQGVGPDFWIYEADAATGDIVYVGVSSM